MHTYWIARQQSTHVVGRLSTYKLKGNADYIIIIIYKKSMTPTYAECATWCHIPHWIPVNISVIKSTTFQKRMKNKNYGKERIKSTMIQIIILSSPKAPLSPNKYRIIEMVSKRPIGCKA